MTKVRTSRSAILQKRARAMRRVSTDAEARLWESLRNHRLGGWKWKRQVPVGPFIADFLCDETRLIVELDGGQHAERQAYDARRTAYLKRLGWRVIRFWNSHVFEGRHEVCLAILDACGGERSGWDPLADSRPLIGESGHAEPPSP